MSRPTDHEETIEHLRDIAGAIRDTAPKPLAEPYPAIDFTAPRIASAADRALLHELAIGLITEALTLVGNGTHKDLTAAAAATTAATTALLACSTDDAKGGA